MKKAFALRISQELWDDIQRLAAADLRSVNSEIEHLLREAVTKRIGKHRDYGPNNEEDTEE